MKKQITIVILSVIIGGCSNLQSTARSPSSTNSFLMNCVDTLHRFFAISNELNESELKIVAKLDEQDSIADVKAFHKEMADLSIKRIRAILESSRLVKALNLDHLDKDFYAQMIKSQTMSNEDFDMLGFPRTVPLSSLKPFRTVGVEIEGVIEDPAVNTYKVIAENIKNFYDKKGRYSAVEKEYTYNFRRDEGFGESAKMPFNTYSPENLSLYKIETKYNRILEVKFDETLVGTPINTFGVEITGPILSRHRDMELFEELVATFEEMHVRSFSQKGGVHIHVGAEGLTVGDYKRMLRKFLDKKDEIYDRFKPEKSRGLQDYFMVKQIELLSKYDESTPLDKVNRVVFHNRGPVAYSPNHKTIEFRLFNSTVDVEEIKEMIRFSLDFVENRSATE